MTVTILTFGQLSTFLKSQQLEIPSPYTLNALNQQFQQEFPDLKRIPYTCAINKNIVTDYNIILKQGDEIAFLPPFSGG